MYLPDSFRRADSLFESNYTCTIDYTTNSYELATASNFLFRSIGQTSSTNIIIILINTILQFIPNIS